MVRLKETSRVTRVAVTRSPVSDFCFHHQNTCFSQMNKWIFMSSQREYNKLSSSDRNETFHSPLVRGLFTFTFRMPVDSNRVTCSFSFFLAQPAGLKWIRVASLDGVGSKICPNFDCILVSCRPINWWESVHSAVDPFWGHRWCSHSTNLAAKCKPESNRAL